MNRRTHKTAKHAHAKQRAHEHFGISLTKEKISSIIKQITSRTATLLQGAEDIYDREVWLVKLEGNDTKAVYQPYDKTIITLMPYDPKEEW